MQEMNIHSILIDTLVEHLGVDKDKVVDDAVIQRDLGADSLDIVEIEMSLEEALGRDLEDLQFTVNETTTVGELEQMIVKIMG